jgi:hypothetical protein
MAYRLYRIAYVRLFNSRSSISMVILAGAAQVVNAVQNPSGQN